MGAVTARAWPALAATGANVVISFLVPSIGRPSLAKTLASIELWPGDEVLVIGELASLGEYVTQENIERGIRFIHCPRGNDWGHAERNYATRFAHGQYLAHIDDDDVYAPNTRAIMQDAIDTTPGRPILFRMRFPNGITLWEDPNLRCGNMGTPCILIPNVPEMLGTFGSFVGGDTHYIETMKWPQESIVFRPEVIALLGHNIG